MANIAVITGSTREGRAGGLVSQWVLSQTEGRENNYLDVDLKDFNLPLLTAPETPLTAEKHYDDPEVQRWSAVIDGADAFIFVTPEYNSSVPGPFKNAFDSLGLEWSKKPVALVGYGYGGAPGSLQAWRQVFNCLLALDATAAELDLDLPTVIQDGKFVESAEIKQQLGKVLDELEAKLA